MICFLVSKTNETGRKGSYLARKESALHHYVLFWGVLCVCFCVYVWLSVSCEHVNVCVWLFVYVCLILTACSPFPSLYSQMLYYRLSWLPPAYTLYAISTRPRVYFSSSSFFFSSSAYTVKTVCVCMCVCICVCVFAYHLLASYHDLFFRLHFFWVIIINFVPRFRAVFLCSLNFNVFFLFFCSFFPHTFQFYIPIQFSCTLSLLFPSRFSIFWFLSFCFIHNSIFVFLITEWLIKNKVSLFCSVSPGKKK